MASLFGAGIAPLRWHHLSRRLVVRHTSICALLVTTLGKGGSGRTTVAIGLARAYAAAGRQTVFASMSSDPTDAAMLLPGSQQLPLVPVEVAPHLFAVRLSYTTMLVQPVAAIVATDVRFGGASSLLQVCSKGFFAAGSEPAAPQELRAEELPLFPGLDSLLVLGALFVLARKYDTVVFDGICSSELVTLLAFPERALWAIRRIRHVLGKSDQGRVGLPASAPILEYLLDVQRGGGGPLDLGPRPAGATTEQIWAELEAYCAALRASLLDPLRFNSFLVAPAGLESALASAKRLWGGANHAGAHVAGIFLTGTPEENAAVAPRFAPLPVHLFGKNILFPTVTSLEAAGRTPATPPPITIDVATATVSAFLPGYGKGQVKLSAVPGLNGVELLLEVGDQRRCVALPAQLQGGVAGAKFLGDSLVVSLVKKA